MFNVMPLCMMHYFIRVAVCFEYTCIHRYLYIQRSRLVSEAIISFTGDYVISAQNVGHFG